MMQYANDNERQPYDLLVKEGTELPLISHKCSKIPILFDYQLTVKMPKRKMNLGVVSRKRKKKLHDEYLQSDARANSEIKGRILKRAVVHRFQKKNVLPGEEDDEGNSFSVTKMYRVKKAPIISSLEKVITEDDEEEFNKGMNNDAGVWSSSSSSSSSSDYSVDNDDPMFTFDTITNEQKHSPAEEQQVVPCSWIRPTLNSCPIDQKVLQESRLPLGLIVNPLANIQDLVYSEPEKCLDCSAYLMEIESGSFCAFCEFPTDCMNKVVGIEGLPCFEFEEDTIGQNVMKKPGFIFAIEMSPTSIECGLDRFFQSWIWEIIGTLPKNTPVGFITYNTQATLYDIHHDLNKVDMDSFLDRFFSPHSKSLTLIKALFDDIASSCGELVDANGILKSVITDGLTIFKKLGIFGKILLFHSSPLQEDSWDFDEDSLTFGVSLDIFLISNTVMNIQGLALLAISTRGCISKCNTLKDRLNCIQLQQEVKYSLSSSTVFGCTLDVHSNYYDNKTLVMSSFSKDASAGLRMEIAGKLNSGDIACTQFVFQYSTLTGKKMTRVLNYYQSTCSTLDDLIVKCDEQVVFTLLVKSYLSKLLQSFTPVHHLLKRCREIAKIAKPFSPAIGRILCSLAYSFRDALSAHLSVQNDQVICIVSSLLSTGVVELVKFIVPKVYLIGGPGVCSDSFSSPIQHSIYSPQPDSAYLWENGFQTEVVLGRNVDFGWMTKMFGTTDPYEIDLENGPIAFELKDLLSNILDSSPRFIKVTIAVLDNLPNLPSPVSETINQSLPSDILPTTTVLNEDISPLPNLISFTSIPPYLEIRKVSENGYGVFTTNFPLSANALLGQVKGDFKITTAGNGGITTETYPRLVKLDEDDESWGLDRSDLDKNNWTMHLRKATDGDEQNAAIIHLSQEIYIVTTKEIQPNTEILVGYGKKYSQKLGFFPYDIGGPFPDSSSDEDIEQFIKTPTILPSQNLTAQWSVGDVEDQLDDHEEDDDNIDQGRNHVDKSEQPDRFQDYILNNELYAKFRENGDEALEEEFDKFVTNSRRFHPVQYKAPKEHKGFIDFNLVEKVAVVKPTLDMLKNNTFENFVKFLQHKGYHLSGLTKIIPPRGFMDGGKDGFLKLYGNPDFDFYPHKQYPDPMSKHNMAVIYAKQDKSRAFNVQSWFEHNKNHGSKMWTLDFDEKKKDLRKALLTTRLYCNDIPGHSLFPKGGPIPEWDFCNLNTFYKRCGNWGEKEGIGLITPYVYFGMYGSTFNWHEEDFSAFSINYLHYGHGKGWNSISHLYYQKWIHAQIALYEKYLQPDNHNATWCEYHPLHKLYSINNDLLRQMNVPVATVYQEPGTYIITHDNAPHSGVSFGFNAAEAINMGVETMNWPLVSAFKNYCPHKDCPQGTSATRDLSPWLEYVGDIKINVYKETGFSKYHPNGFNVGNKPRIKLNLENPIQPYIVKNLQVETIAIGNRLRGIFSTDAELAVLKRKRNLKQEIEELQKIDKNYSSNC